MTFVCQAPNKWELYAEKKERLINQPELHPALGHNTPNYSNADGSPAPTESKVHTYQQADITLLGDCLIDDELNQALIRQIIDMYAALDNSKEVLDENETEDDIDFAEKGNLEAPL